MVSASVVRSIACTLFAFFALSACNSGTLDSGGRNISLSDEVEIQPWESRFNGFLFLDENREFNAITYQRDNGRGIVEEVTSPGFKLYVEHINSTWYSPATVEKVQAKEDLERQLANMDGPFEYAPISTTAAAPTGWIATNGVCQFSQFTVRLKGRSIYDNDQGQHDTVVSVSDCSRVITEAEGLYADFNFLDDEGLSLLTEKYGT